MKTIKLDKAIHRGEEVVLIQFPYDNKLGDEARKIKNIRWSKSLKAWHVPYSIAVLNEIKDIFDSISIIDAQALKVTIAKEKTLIANKKELSTETLKQIEKFINWLHSRRYSENTVKTYSEALKAFLLYFHKKRINEITNDDLIEFNNKYILAKNYSASFQNQVVNAIKLFFRTMQNIKIDVQLIHRPKNPKLLPNVLSKEEIKMILDSPSNIKHKTMLSLIYSCGLRCGETLRLKPEHIDPNRNLIIIKQSKGRKDRIVPLSDKINKLLQEYYLVYKPTVYVFEGFFRHTLHQVEFLQIHKLLAYKLNNTLAIIY